MSLSKLFLCLLLTAILYKPGAAQPGVTEYKDFTSDEKKMKVCDFDKEADAVIFFDVAAGTYNDEHNLILIRRIRFKILKEKGISRSNIEIPFYSKNNFESLRNINAAVQTIDGNGATVVKEIRPSDVFYQKVNDRISVAKFAVPNVKVGSIIDYTYESRCEHYGGLRDWYFQSDIPTLFSSFSVVIVPNADFQYVVRKSADMPIVVDTKNTDGLVKFEMKNIPGLRDEPYMEAERDYIQRVEFQLAAYKLANGSNVNYLNTWSSVSKELMTENYFGKQIDKNLSNADQLLLKAKELTAEEKLKYIYDSVRRSFTWNNINTKFVDDGIKTAWENKKGNSAEINFIFMNLLKSSGLTVYPLLVSSRSHGKVTTDYPILDQFNRVVAYVVIDNKKYILDATDPYTPINLIPFNILNTNAFIVNTKAGGIIQLKDDVSSLTNIIDINSILNENGTIAGSATIISTDYARVERLRQVRQNKEKFKSQFLALNNENARIDSFEVDNADIDSLPFDQHFKYETVATSSGDYKLINLNQFTTLEKNPFISENRFTNINFGSRHVTNVHETFVVPASLKPEELPKNITLTTSDRSLVFSRNITYQNNEISVSLSFTINQTVFIADDYPSIKEYYKRMNSLLNEQIVLSKK